MVEAVTWSAGFASRSDAATRFRFVAKMTLCQEGDTDESEVVVVAEPGAPTENIACVDRGRHADLRRPVEAGALP
jgi:hypothetical protein